VLRVERQWIFARERGCEDDHRRSDLFWYGAKDLTMLVQAGKAGTSAPQRIDSSKVLVKQAIIANNGWWFIRRLPTVDKYLSRPHLGSLRHVVLPLHQLFLLLYLLRLSS